MDRSAATTNLAKALPVSVSTTALLRQLLVLSGPVLAENLLHILVGINDTWLANHVHKFTSAAEVASTAARAIEADATAAVGSITYVLWFMGMIVGAVGTGSTAIIARATGARHRSLANGICGQSVSATFVVGVVTGLLMFFFAGALADAAGLQGRAHGFAVSYMRMLSWSLPPFMLMFVANACLRGAGDTLTPAATMIAVDIINLFFSFGLTYGWFGLPNLGFNGIAGGTVIAYVAGGSIQIGVLLLGRGGIKLHLHRLWPHWHHLKRLLRIGIPAGVGDAIQWASNFVVLHLINRLDVANVAPAAHTNTIRIESFSYMTGYAISVAAATMVGQSLGRKDPHAAHRSGYLAYALGALAMSAFGLFFIFFGHIPASLMSENESVIKLTTECLFITGFCQPFFAGAIIFSNALRGAGDTFKTMIISLASILAVRLGGAIIVTQVFGLGLTAVWFALIADLVVRGTLLLLRFQFGKWREIEV